MSLGRRWLSLLIGLLAPAAMAQPLGPALKPPPVTPAIAAAPAPASSGHVLDKADLEAWLDGFMPYALARGDIPGAVVAVVKDGQPLLVKGYGYSDLAKKTPVTPDTLFRPGSVSKLFTWTAVMQLVGEGKLDLDKDVNAYLDFRIPDRPDGPITLRRLMTHTAGFEETIQDLINADPKRMRTLATAMKQWIPERMYKAGSTPAYSNYGASLAGYIVQRVSGEPFEAYVARHIFQPLGMTHSTMVQPLPAALQPFMSKGYDSGSDKAQPYELIDMSPAGALAMSGADATRFMIAHLAAEHGPNVLLPPDVAREMHRTAAPGIGPLNRMALGFYQSNMNGHAIISHGGDTQWFHSDLNLFIDDGVGLFINVNSPGGEGAAHVLRGALLRAFADRYFPGPTTSGQVSPAVAKAHAAMLAGTYLNSRGSHSNWASIVDFLGETKVAALPDGKVVVSGLTGVNGKPIKWREIAPFVWQDVNGPQLLAAVVENGKVVRIANGDYAPIMVFDRAPAATSAAWLMPALLAAIVVLALTALLWPVTALVRRKYGVPFGLSGDEAKSHRAARAGAVATLAVALGWALVVVVGLKALDFFGPPAAPWLLILGLLGPLLLIAALAGTLWDAWMIWTRRRGWRSWLARLWSAALVLSVLVCLWMIVAFHMYGPSSHY
jgi:CubicO group peptidase (beta-lactamase class C family)